MNKKTKIFLIILVVIIIILLIINLFTKRFVPQTFSPSPTPARLIQSDPNILEQQQQTQKTNYPLINKTPYKTTDFEVYYTNPLELTVTMFTDNEIKIRSEVEAWLIENKIKPGSHQIIYSPLYPSPAPTKTQEQ